jgi:hypothetical protein
MKGQSGGVCSRGSEGVGRRPPHCAHETRGPGSREEAVMQKDTRATPMPTAKVAHDLLLTDRGGDSCRRLL